MSEGWDGADQNGLPVAGLKPCPFCGGKDTARFGHDGQSIHIYCDACDAVGPQSWLQVGNGDRYFFGMPDIEFAALKWDRRGRLSK